jgi:nucleotide-binding universal stress UspA family protein
MSVFGTRILVATDGSPESVRAARTATELSNKLGLELHVVYVEPTPDVYGIPERAIYFPETQDYLRTVERHAHERISEEAAKIRESGGEIAEAYPRVGRPDAEIVWLAEELDAGLVIVGSRGLGPFKRVLLGSVSNNVVRHAHGSVLVARGDGRGEGDHLPSRLLLAIDGSSEAAAATRAAVELANAIRSELHVMFALETGLRLSYLGPEVRDRWEEALEETKRKARAWVDQQAKRIEAEGGMVEGTHLTLGKPDEEIVKVGEELDAGLIVLGSRGLGSINRALMGGVSDSVVRHAHCPVIVVRDP